MTQLRQDEYLFELVNDSVMTRTMDGMIKFWNRSAEKLYGWRKEEAIGRVSHNLLQTQFPKPLQEIESELVRTGLWEGKLVHTTRDGGRVVVESRWALDLKAQSEALIEINTRSTDDELDPEARTDEITTERKQTQNLLEQTVTTLQQHEYLFELVNDSVMTRTMEGRINFWNRSAEQFYGWRKQEAIGKVSHSLLQTQFPKALQEIESELVRNGQWQGKLVHTTRDGGRVVVESRWALDPRGESGAIIEINTRSPVSEIDPEARTNSYSAEIGRQKPLPARQLNKRLFIYPTIALFSVIIISWVLYGLLGHQLIEAMYYSDNILANKIMEGKAVTSLEEYYENGAYQFITGTFRLFALFLVFTIVVGFIKEPLKVLLACSSLVISSFLLFCILETFPSLIKPLRLDVIHYFANKSNRVADETLGYRGRPFLRARIDGFRGGSYSPLYGVEVQPRTVVWETNEDGFRSNKAPTVSDIVVIGDSFIEWGLDEADTFVRRVENHLPGLAVSNLALGGYGPFQYLEVLKRYGVIQKPKYALFSFYEGNDIVDIDEYLKWKRGEQRGISVYIPAQFSSPFHLRYVMALEATLTQFTNMAWTTAKLSLDRMTRHTSQSKYVHPDVAVLKIGAEEYRIAFVDRLSTKASGELLSTEEWKELRTILAQFRDVCASNEIVPVIMYIPMAAHIYAEYSTAKSGKNWLWIREEQINAKRNLEDAMMTLSRELDIQLINLVPVFERAAKEGKMLYHNLDTHWNSEGREVAARFVAETLKELGSVRGNDT